MAMGKIFNSQNHIHHITITRLSYIITNSSRQIHQKKLHVTHQTQSPPYTTTIPSLKTYSTNSSTNSALHTHTSPSPHLPPNIHTIVTHCIEETTFWLHLSSVLPSMQGKNLAYIPCATLVPKAIKWPCLAAHINHDTSTLLIINNDDQSQNTFNPLRQPGATPLITIPVPLTIEYGIPPHCLTIESSLTAILLISHKHHSTNINTFMQSSPPTLIQENNTYSMTETYQPINKIPEEWHNTLPTSPLSPHLPISNTHLPPMCHQLTPP